MNEDEKFEAEISLRREEIEIERKRQNLESRRMKYVGVGVPLILALVAAGPVAINGYYQNEIDKARLEAANPSGYTLDRNLVREVITKNKTKDAAAMLQGMVAAKAFQRMDDKDVYQVWLALKGGCVWTEAIGLWVQLSCDAKSLKAAKDVKQINPRDLELPD